MGYLNHQTLLFLQLLVLVPTRELADQVSLVIKDISSYTEITSLKVIGGTNVSMCREDLSKRPHIIIGTPGRVLDMISRRYLYTSELKTLIFDEADEILSYGFKDCIYEIVKVIPKNTQICLFSATIPDEILELTTKFMKDPEKVLVKKEELSDTAQWIANHFEQIFIIFCIFCVFGSLLFFLRLYRNRYHESKIIYYQSYF